MKSEEVTDNQLSVLAALIKVGITPYADFGVWKPLGQLQPRPQILRLIFWTTVALGEPKKCLANTRLQPGKLAGECSGRLLSCVSDIATPAVFDRYAAKFRERVDRFSDAWHLCVLADTRCRSCGSQSFGDNRSSTTQILKFLPSCPVDLGNMTR